MNKQYNVTAVYGSPSPRRRAQVNVYALRGDKGLDHATVVARYLDPQADSLTVEEQDAWLEVVK